MKPTTRIVLYLIGAISFVAWIANYIGKAV